MKVKTQKYINREKNITLIFLSFIKNTKYIIKYVGGRNRIVVGFITTYMQSVPITTNVVSSNPLRRGVLDITLCDKVCQWLVAGQWFFLGTRVSSINKTDRHYINEILLKVVLNTITLNSIKYAFNMINPIRKTWISYEYSQSYLKKNPNILNIKFQFLYTGIQIMILIQPINFHSTLYNTIPGTPVSSTIINWPK